MSHSTPARILIVEDDEAVRVTLNDILALNGFEVLTASDGEEGLALARRDEPACVITDVAMPRMDGYELLRAIRHDNALRSVPVIMLTARTDRAATRHGMELGADDYITKPFTEEEVVRSLRARLEKKELLDELDAFAHTVAHDLRGPLAILSGRIELMELTLAQSDAAGRRHQLEEALRSARRLNAIIEDLLVLSGVRRQRVEPAPLDMAAVVREALERVEDLVRRAEADVQLPPAWPVALGHAPWIAHVWANYVGNAAKYAGPKPRIRLGASPSPTPGRIRYSVTDEGPGIDPDIQPRLFAPFTRIPSARVTGHGLGLSIVRRIVEKLGGTVGVDSSPGQGACFWFDLPTP